MLLSLIAAVADNNALGKDGDLLWHLPNDLKHFKALTLGHSVVMGARTYFSLPRRPLPKRRNIVLTSRTLPEFEGAELARSIPDALRMTASEDEVFVIGGGTVYEQTLPFADKLYITHVHHSFDEADTFFPTIEPQDWTLEQQEEHPADERHPYPYTFAIYIRNKKHEL